MSGTERPVTEDPKLKAILTWLDGSWQAADNRREAAIVAALVREQAAEICRLREALKVIAEGTICPELFPELDMERDEWELAAKTASVSAIAALEPR